MLSELFDEEALCERYYIAIKKQAREEGFKEGFREGIKEGREEALKDIVCRMLSIGKMSAEEIADATGFTLDKINKIAAQM